MTKQSERKVWWNGEMIVESEARLSIYDSALMFGDMVFEMTRSFKGEHFKLHAHLKRLADSAKYVRIPIEYSMLEIIGAIKEVCVENSQIFTEDDEHRLMINVTRGLLPLYNDVDINKGPNLIISDFPLRWTVKGMGKYYNDGVELVTPSQRTIPADLLECKVKSRSRLHLMMASIQANGKWPLLLDPDGYITEGSGYNFFVVKGGMLMTPEPRNILRGISRHYIMELANELDISIKETNLNLYDVELADEAFITATPFCALPVKSINGVELTCSVPGKVTRLLLKTWSKKVGVDIIKQIQDWNEIDGVGDSQGITPYGSKN